MEVWVQPPLFDEPSIAQPTTVVPSPHGTSVGRRWQGRLDRSRVTRDPAVALSHAHGAAVAHDVRLGFARAFAELPPEQREAIRAALRRERSTSAA